MANEKADEANTEVVVDTGKNNQETKTTETNTDIGEGDEVVVLIDGVSPNPEDEDEDTAETPAWIKDLRQRYKETTKLVRTKDDEIRQLKATIPSNKATEVGAKPTLENCEYDEAKFESELLSWQKRKDNAEAEKAVQQQEAENIQKAYQAKQQDYEVAKGNLKVKDFPEAEDAVKAAFSIVQQGIIIKGCKNASIVVYALGKNPDTSKKLAAIKDPIDFAFAVAHLEGNLKVSTKKAPLPEKTPRASGGASNSGGVDKELERLRAVAEKTNNYTEVIRYKKQLKDKTG